MFEYICSFSIIFSQLKNTSKKKDTLYVYETGKTPYYISYCSLVSIGTEPLPVKLNDVTLKSKNDTKADILTWLRGPANDEGYFTLKNPSSGKLLTRVNNERLMIKSNILMPFTLLQI